MRLGISSRGVSIASSPRVRALGSLKEPNLVSREDLPLKEEKDEFMGRYKSVTESQQSLHSQSKSHLDPCHLTRRLCLQL